MEKSQSQFIIVISSPKFKRKLEMKKNSSTSSNDDYAAAADGNDDEGQMCEETFFFLHSRTTNNCDRLNYFFCFVFHLKNSVSIILLSCLLMIFFYSFSCDFFSTFWLNFCPIIIIIIINLSYWNEWKILWHIPFASWFLWSFQSIIQSINQTINDRVSNFFFLLCSSICVCVCVCVSTPKTDQIHTHTHTQTTEREWVLWVLVTRYKNTESW